MVGEVFGEKVEKIALAKGASFNIINHKVFELLKWRCWEESKDVGGMIAGAHTRMAIHIGPVHSIETFYIVKDETDYDILLGESWCKRHKIATSAARKSMHATWLGKRIEVPSTTWPYYGLPQHEIQGPFYLARIGKLPTNRALFDKGVAFNLMSYGMFHKLGMSMIKAHAKVEETQVWTGRSLQSVVGTVRANVQVGNMSTMETFYVMNERQPYDVLLGRPWHNNNNRAMHPKWDSPYQGVSQQEKTELPNLTGTIMKKTKPQPKKIWVPKGRPPLANCNMITGGDPMIEESGEIHYEPHVHVPDHDIQAKALMESVKFKRFFDQLELKKDARVEATKAIIRAAERQECMQIDPKVPKFCKEGINKISFSEADKELRQLSNRPLYVTALVNGYEVKRAFIDNGSSLNIMPYKVFQTLGVPEKKIVPRGTSIVGITNNTITSLGFVRIDLQVGKIRGLTTFHVIDCEASYHVLLGRPWINANGAVPSTYHQCIKAIYNGKEVTIQATKRPFAMDEAYLSEASLFEEPMEDEYPMGGMQEGTSLPKWNNVEKGDYTPSEPKAVTDAREFIEKRKAAEHAQEMEIEQPEQKWRRVVLPNGKIAFRWF
jgi:hypothetical protein